MATVKKETIKYIIKPIIHVSDVNGTTIKKGDRRYNIKPALEYMKKHKKMIGDMSLIDLEENGLKYENLEIKYFDDVDDDLNKTCFIQCTFTYEMDSLPEYFSSIDNGLKESYFTMKYYIDSEEKYGSKPLWTDIDNPNNFRY